MADSPMTPTEQALEDARKVLGRKKLLNPADPECSPEVYTEDAEKVSLARALLALADENAAMRASLINAANALDEAANVLADAYPTFARLIRDNAGFARQALGER